MPLGLTAAAGGYQERVGVVVTDGSCRVTWDYHTMGTQQEKITWAASRVNFYPIGPGIRIGDDIWGGITCLM